MKAHPIVLAVFGITGGLLAPGCSTYHDPATGEKATYGMQTLKARLDEADTNLAQARESLLEAYGRWRRALEDVENLWALGAWRSATAEEPAEQAAALAA